VIDIGLLKTILTYIDGLPRHAVANLIGNINGQQFGVSTISATIHRVDVGSQMNAHLTDIPPNVSE